jgi:hypothetical protein
MIENREEHARVTRSARHRCMVGTVVLLIVLSGFVLGFLPRWREYHTPSVV